MSELKQALIRFNLGLQDKELKMFIARLDRDQTDYMTKEEFVQRFWAAYTYDDVFTDEDFAESALSNV